MNKEPLIECIAGLAFFGGALLLVTALAAFIGLRVDRARLRKMAEEARGE